MASANLDSIFLFGDSLTERGWQPGAFVQRLAINYARKFDVVNRGMGGYNTRWALPCLEQLLIPRTAQETGKHPVMRMLFIWFGCNDASLPPLPFHVPLAEYRSNLKKMIRMVTSDSSPYYSPETKVLLLTPPPLNTTQWGATPKPYDSLLEFDRTFETTKAYAEAVKEVAKEEGVLLVDIWQAIWDKSGKNEEGLTGYLSDGLHFLPAGYEVSLSLSS